MEDSELVEVAYDMQAAYKNNRNREHAVIEVAIKHPDVKAGILRAMWQAIDAYTDLIDEDTPEIFPGTLEALKDISIIEDKK